MLFRSNSATGPNIGGVNASVMERNEGVTNFMASTCMAINSVGPSKAEMSEVEQSNVEQVAGSVHNGPLKPRPKWNRLTRMEYGPGVENKGDLTTSLGKRSASTIWEEENAESLEVQGSKRGKVQDVLDDFFVAGVSKHPCQPQ